MGILENHSPGDLNVPFTWTKDPKKFRDSLPKDTDNYIVYCERCKKEHRYYTFTQEDYDKWLSEATQGLADNIDATIEKEVFG